MLSIQSDVPIPVRVLGWLWYLSAVCAVVHIAIGLLFQKRLNFDFNVLGFWMGPGLVRGDRRWWSWAVNLTCFGIVAILAIVWFVLGQGSDGLMLTFNVFDYPVGRMSLFQFIVFAAALEFLAFWSLWVLQKYRGFAYPSPAG